MSESRRIKRMERHHKRKKTVMSLNMVSLMDIFTILVFFLLVTSSDSEVLPSPKAIKLPESTADKMPKQTIVVMVNNDDIRVNGEFVIKASKAKNSRSATIRPLSTMLKKYIKRDRAKKKSKDKNKRRPVTIMGDKQIPYKLLKKIMLTCAQNDFNNISLAVVKKSPDLNNKAGAK